MLITDPQSKAGTVLKAVKESKVLRVCVSISIIYDSTNANDSNKVSNDQPQIRIRETMKASLPFIEACERATFTFEAVLQDFNTRGLTIRDCSSLMSNFDSIANKSTAVLVPVIQLEESFHGGLFSGAVGTTFGLGGMACAAMLNPALALGVAIPSVVLATKSTRQLVKYTSFWAIAKDSKSSTKFHLSYLPPDSEIDANFDVVVSLQNHRQNKRDYYRFLFGNALLCTCQ